MSRSPKGYVAKVTVWLHVESDYASGVGEAQREVRHIIAGLVKSDPSVKATAVEFHDAMKELLPGRLIVKPTECDNSVIYVPPKGKRIVVDDGGR